MKAEEIASTKGATMTENEREALERVQGIENQIESSILHIETCLLTLEM